MKYAIPSMIDIHNTPWNGRNVASLFAGCGGSRLGYRMAGYRVGWANEVDPAARASYAANSDAILDGRDVREVKPTDILKALKLKRGQLDILDGSPPCFAAGTPVLTMRGVVPIETVIDGDMVMTHCGRWRRVTRTMSRRASTVMVEKRIEVTPQHAFYLRRTLMASPDWIPAADSSGLFGGSPVDFPATAPPIPPEGFVYDAAFWYFVGRWVGDGWVRLTGGDDVQSLDTRPRCSPVSVPCRNCGNPSVKIARPGRVMFTHYCSRRCANAHKRNRRQRPRGEVYVCTGHNDPTLRMQLAKWGVPFWDSRERTATRFVISRRGLAEWLTQHFGRGAPNKTLPGWLFGCPAEWREAILRGYLDADGSVNHICSSSSSVSRCLTTAIALLVGTLGHAASITWTKRKLTTIIEGRRVTQRDSWLARWSGGNGYTHVDAGVRWRKLRKSVKPARRSTTVYDIEVSDDHSFVADVFLVHNCTAFSTNGIREEGWNVPRKHSGIVQRVDDLFDEYVRLLDGLRPRTFVAENVVGLTMGVAVGYFNELLAKLRAPGYAVKAAIIDTSQLGVPQARRRVIIHGVRTDQGVGPSFPSPLPGKPFTCGDAWVGLPKITAEERADLLLKEGSQGRRMWDRTIPGETFVKASQRLKGTDSFFGWRRLAFSKPAATILSATPLYFYPDEPRLLTIAEVKRVSSFPDDFVLEGSHAEQWKRLGNCVPPFVMRAMGLHIAKHVFTS